MKIGLDVQLLTGGNKTGVGWCADNIVKELAKDSDYECEMNFFSLRGNGENLEEYVGYGAKKHKCGWFPGTGFNWISRFLPLPYRWFFGGKQDIVQFFNYAVPAGVKGKTVTIVHDMAYKSCPETVKKRTRDWLETVLAKSCRRADAIITVSEFSKQELMRYLQVPEKKITVMPNGVDFTVYRPDYSRTQIEDAKVHYQIEGEYLLYLGTLEPRKNLVRLIEAYAMLREKMAAPKLVLAGGKGWYYEGIFARVKELGLERDVVFTGYVDAADVAPLMCGAVVFMFPSLYEGFGMPPAEAMACGTPVIASNTSSLPEVVGDAGLQVTPESVEEICDAMERLLTNEELRLELAQKGLERAKQFSWERSVGILKDVYRKLEDNQ